MIFGSSTIQANFSATEFVNLASFAILKYLPLVAVINNIFIIHGSAIKSGSDMVNSNFEKFYQLHTTSIFAKLN